MNHDNVPIAATCFTLTLVVVVDVFGLRGCIPDKPTTPPTSTTPTAGGCPLDAISYVPPVWMTECTRCQRVTDRITGRRWWMLTMSDGSHVVLPLDEMEGK
jgi:hypothetical protein